MADDRRGGRGRSPTLGDALSDSARAGLRQLAHELELRVRGRIDAQIARPREPWRKRPPIGPAASKVGPGPISRPGPLVAGAAAGMAARVTAKAAAMPASSGGSGAPPIATAGQGRSLSPPSAVQWLLPARAAVREAPPNWIGAHDRAAMEAALERGSESSDANSSGEPIHATIGLDFGTSCTKIIVRFPEEPGAPAVAVPAPAHCRSGGDPYLWQTVVWVRRDGTFVAWPESNTYPLHTLKQGIMGNRPTEVVAPNYGSVPITHLDAATAYLAFAVRYARGWLLLNQPERFRGRRPYWFTNMGLPAANYDQARLVTGYRAIAATALVLAGSGERIAVETVRAFASSAEVREAAAAPAAAEELGIAVFPEVAAEVAGFMKSAAGGSGLYVMVDVGAMTLDLCAFRFKQRQVEGDLYPLLEADVHHLGVEAYHWFIGEGRTHEAFSSQCQSVLRTLIWKTKRERDPNASCWRPGNDLPVFLVGGGAENELHQKSVEALRPWLRDWLKNEGIRLTALPQPAGLEMPEPGGNFARLPVAWGLSYAPTEIGEIIPPSNIPDVPPATVRNYLGNFVSKDQM